MKRIFEWRLENKQKNIDKIMGVKLSDTDSIKRALEIYMTHFLEQCEGKDWLDDEFSITIDVREQN